MVLIGLYVYKGSVVFISFIGLCISRVCLNWAFAGLIIFGLEFAKIGCFFNELHSGY